MLKQLLPPGQVALDAEGMDTPEEVLRYAAQMMVNAGKAAQEYVEQVVAAYTEMGPYFVVAPGIALPHIRPSGTVFESGVCFVRLKAPVRFGHSSNDPVRLVFLLAGTQSGSHLQMIGALGSVLSDESHMKRLYEAKTYRELVD